MAAPVANAAAEAEWPLGNDEVQGRSPMRHLWPFLIHGYLYVTVDQSVNVSLLFLRESCGE